MSNNFIGRALCWKATRITAPESGTPMSILPLHLASASPRRREILTSLGLQFTYAGEDLDEQAQPGETAAELVVRLASDKAMAALRSRPESLVLGADTVVVLGGEVFGKPADQDEAVAMLAALSGRAHEVMTGVVLLSREHRLSALSCSQVRFRDISQAEAEAYWRTGEPQDKAGGYAVQGLAAVFIAELRGSYSGVMGLPVFETAAMLRSAGMEVLNQ